PADGLCAGRCGMTQLARRLEEAPSNHSDMATAEKIIQRESHLGELARGGSGFSAGFFAGIVLFCDIAGIAMCGLASHLFHTGEATHDFLRHATAIALFGVLTLLALNSTGLYHFAAI